MSTVDTAALHGPAPSGSLVVSVNKTVPLVIDGVYVDVKDALLLNVPLGDDHVELVAEPPRVPASVIVPPAQTVCGVPAFAVAAGLTVISTVETAAEQGPAPSGSLVVSVNVTVPLVMEGVYVDVNEPVLLNVPLGADHVELVAEPPRVPAKVTVPPAQTVCGEPALAVGGLLAVAVALMTLLTHPVVEFLVLAETVIDEPAVTDEVVYEFPVPATLLKLFSDH
jgi:hypothetical protein